MSLHRLAELFRVKDPDSLLDEMTPAQLRNWQRYERHHGYRDDLLWGMMISEIRNAVMSWASNPEFTAPCDFMPYYVRPAPDPAEVANKIRQRSRKRKASHSTNQQSRHSTTGRHEKPRAETGSSKEGCPEVSSGTTAGVS